ncbi:hypothetical protein AVEN_245682-2 [Araneus ventricosus]|uniref:Uncharacterized protein n=1 Tax=Araneus ventricosus TaxID=182803 RepID=A0A4Y2NV32_ARAVE|nr:hypothetical protein AVEN_245682-2 [Araneus ventricosus]
MELLKPLDTRRHPSQKIFVHKDLHTCTHVFIRIDRVRKPLEPPCDGPFPVVKRHDKYFVVTIKSKDINISVDRLKPAYLLRSGYAKLSRVNYIALFLPQHRVIQFYVAVSFCLCLMLKQFLGENEASYFFISTKRDKKCSLASMENVEAV